MVIFYHEIAHVIFEGVIQDRLANLVANADDETFVMDAGESFAGNLVDFIEVMQIGCVVIFTTIAITVWIDWRELGAVFSVLDIDTTVWRVEGAVAGLAGWGDAVKSVAAVHGTDEQIARFGAHAE